MNFTNILINIFWNADIYNACIRINKLLAIILSCCIQTGLSVGPIIGILIPNSWKLIYKILIGAMFGIFLSSIKDAFTAGERKRELEALRIKLEQHDAHNIKQDERLSNHDAHNIKQDERLSNHDAHNIKQDAYNIKQDAHNIKQDAHNINHDAHNIKQDALLSNHDARLFKQDEEIKWITPFIYTPMDLKSP